MIRHQFQEALQDFREKSLLLAASASLGLISAPAATASAQSAGRNSPRFVVTSKGVTIPIPKGATGPTNVVNQQDRITGHYYSGGRDGANGQVSTVRIMNPTPARGRAPAYPDGYATYENGTGPNAQAVDPRTGQTVPPSQAHHSLTP